MLIDSIVLAGTLLAPPRTPLSPGLCRSWTAVSKSSPDGIRPWKESPRLHLSSDGSFRSFSPPTNHHRGTWHLRADSALVLHLKALKTWRIVELTDTSLVLRALWKSDTLDLIRFRPTSALSNSGSAAPNRFTQPPPRRPPLPECRIQRVDTLPPAPGSPPLFQTAEDGPGILFHDSTRTLAYHFAHRPLVELKWSLSPLRAYWLAWNTVCALDPRTGLSVPLMEHPMISAIGVLTLQDSVLHVTTDSATSTSFRPDAASPTGYSPPNPNTTPRAHKPRRRP